MTWEAFADAVLSCYSAFCSDREEPAAAAAQEMSVNGPVWEPVEPAGFSSEDFLCPLEWFLKNLIAAPLFL